MNKQLLTTLNNRIGMIYLDQAEIKQKDYSVIAVSKEVEYDIPIANITCLILGPGTSITHRAIEQISQYGCSIIWSGENLNLYYALGQPLTQLSKNILKQVKAYGSKVSRLNVIRKMYSIRYTDLKIKSKTEDELIGIEGMHMQNTYKQLSLKYNIPWNGRVYNVPDFNCQDDINKAITATNQLLYAIIVSVINALGYSPAIGFVHTGKMMSFVYDIADLYKECITLPKVFEFTHNYKGNSIAKDVKTYIYKELIQVNIVDKIINDINTLFNDMECTN